MIRPPRTSISTESSPSPWASSPSWLGLGSPTKACCTLRRFMAYLPCKACASWHPACVDLLARPGPGQLLNLDDQLVALQGIGGLVRLGRRLPLDRHDATAMGRRLDAD